MNYSDLWQRHLEVVARANQLMSLLSGNVCKYGQDELMNTVVIAVSHRPICNTGELILEKIADNPYVLRTERRPFN